MRTDFSAAVIAGGAGRRMGFDKRLLMVDGVPLVVRAVAAVAPLASEVLVAVSRDHPLPGRLLPDPRVRIVVDRVAGGGPLAGIEAALLEAQHDLVLVVAGDLPWLQPKLLRLLV